MGIYYNFIQIFGKNPWLWFLPVTLKSGKPVGDGVVWPQKPSNAYLILSLIIDCFLAKDMKLT